MFRLVQVEQASQCYTYFKNTGSHREFRVFVKVGFALVCPDLAEDGSTGAIVHSDRVVLYVTLLSFGELAGRDDSLESKSINWLTASQTPVHPWGVIPLSELTCVSLDDTHFIKASAYLVLPNIKLLFSSDGLPIEALPTVLFHHLTILLGFRKVNFEPRKVFIWI